MNKVPIFRRLLLSPPNLRASLLSHRVASPTSRSYAVQSITQTSFWAGLIPKPLRKSERSASSKKPKSKDWNPATFFICIFLLIGSMSIQMIALRNESTTFNRRADAKIGLLKEIIERIKNGENVDVEGLLGTGDKEKEQEWEEVLQEFEREEKASEHSQKGNARSEPKVEVKPPSKLDAEKQDASPIKTKSSAPRGFY